MLIILRALRTNPEELEPNQGDGGPSLGNEQEHEVAREEVFEEAFARAELAADRLERGEATLQECLAEYETGARALRSCYRILRQAQRRLEVLSDEIGIGEGGLDSGQQKSVAGSSGPWAPASASGALREVLERLEDEDDTPPGEEARPSGES